MDEKRTRLCIIPVTKVNTIMKSSSDVENVSKESSIIMSRAAEMFIRALTQKGFQEKGCGKKLDYKALADVVHNNDKYNFLRDILPKKITVRQFKWIMAQKKAKEVGSDDSSSADEEESSEDSENGSSDN